jgi:site-specific DNA-methyltransferase (adenine-specific)
MTALSRRRIFVGDAAEVLRRFPAASVDCAITSPPYYALRDYGAPGQIGLERNVDEWVAAVREVMRQVARTLKPSGSLWLNLGDSYSRAMRYGAPPKSLLLAPERLLVALLFDGWLVRNKVIYAKTNPMPHSVGDRLNTTFEFVYFLVRSPRYYFDLDAIREPHTSSRPGPARPAPARPPVWTGPLAGGTQAGLSRAREADVPGHVLGKNPGDVWRLGTRGYRGAHFATFPEELVRRPLLATCPERICLQCGIPWRRGVDLTIVGQRRPAGEDRYVRRYPNRWETRRRLGPMRSGCSCGAPTEPGVVLDPFFGTGTVGVVAERYGRDWTGVELNPKFARMARQRIESARTTSSREQIAA